MVKNLQNDIDDFVVNYPMEDAPADCEQEDTYNWNTSMDNTDEDDEIVISEDDKLQITIHKRFLIFKPSEE